MQWVRLLRVAVGGLPRPGWGMSGRGGGERSVSDVLGQISPSLLSSPLSVLKTDVVEVTSTHGKKKSRTVV